MLADGQVEPLDKRRLDLPAAGCQHLLHRLTRPADDAVTDAYEAPAPHGLDHLRIEQLRSRHPTRLRRRAMGLAAGRLHPLPIVGEQSRRVLAKAIGENSGAQSGANTWVTWWTKRCAMAWVRAPPSRATSSLVTGSIAPQTQWGERDKRLIALASVISPSLTALSTAYSSSSCSCWTCRSQRK